MAKVKGSADMRLIAVAFLAPYATAEDFLLIESPTDGSTASPVPDFPGGG